MNMQYLDSDNTLKYPIMGCYGIGIYMLLTGSDTDPLFIKGVVLPNNTPACNFTPSITEKNWARYKVSIDLDANGGAGAVTLYAMYDVPGGEWEAVPECQGVNIGLTPGSGDKFDPATWHHIFMLNSGWCGFDNFTVRHFPGGLAAQFIEFNEIPDQLSYNAPITLEATSTSGLPVTFEVVQGPATIDGNGIVNNTWIKMRELSLTYDFPRKWLDKQNLFKQASISLVGRDLFYFFKTLPDNINPEGTQGSGNAQGLEYASYPGSRSFMLTLKVNL